MTLIKGKQIALGASGVQTANIEDLAITTGKLAANAVTAAKAKLDEVWAFTAAPTYNADPSGANDLARKSYVDALGQGLRDFKDSVHGATTANLAATRSGNVLTATANGTLANVDGVTWVINNRYLIKDQTTGADNGLYTLTDPGSAGTPFIFTRATDADASAEVTAGMYVFVSEGTANADTAWVLSTNDTITLNTTALTFVQFSGVGQIVAGTGLTKTAPNTLNVGAGNGITANADDIEVIYGLVGELVAHTPDVAAAAGTTNKAARIDHVHNLPTDVPVAVGTANSEGTGSSFARNDHVHDSPAPTTSNKFMAASATTADNQVACATTIAATPALDGMVVVTVNGLEYELGDGVKTKDCYFSADSGTTARAISAITAADTLYWVQSVAGFNLATSDKISFHYEV